MVRPTSRAGAGQDLVSTVLIPRAISDTQGWCRVMAYIQSALVGPVVLGGLRSPRHNRHRSGAGSDLGDAGGGGKSPLRTSIRRAVISSNSTLGSRPAPWRTRSHDWRPRRWNSYSCECPNCDWGHPPA